MEYPWPVLLGREPEDTILRQLHSHQLAHWQQQSRAPWVTLSFAASLDGKIDTRPRPVGAPWRLSNARTMRLTHAVRAAHDAVTVGYGTLLADDPLLSVRYGVAERMPPEWRPPKAMVLLPHNVQRVPETCRLWRERRTALIEQPRAAGVAHPGVRAVMLEGGARVITAALQGAPGGAKDTTDLYYHLLLLTISPCWLGSDTTGVAAYTSRATDPLSDVPRVRPIGCWTLDDNVVILGVPPETSPTNTARGE